MVCILHFPSCGIFFLSLIAYVIFVRKKHFRYHQYQNVLSIYKTSITVASAMCYKCLCHCYNNILRKKKISTACKLHMGFFFSWLKINYWGKDICDIKIIIHYEASRSGWEKKDRIKQRTWGCTITFLAVYEIRYIYKDEKPKSCCVVFFILYLVSHTHSVVVPTVNARLFPACDDYNWF